MADAAEATLLDRALGAYLGLALGDALGATVEFMTPREIRLRHGVHRQIIGGGWLKLKAGQVTDDTTMSLALGDALLRGAREGRPHDTTLIAEAFVAWWRAKPVDCGNTCRRGIQRYLRDHSLAGPPCEGDGGNGALMRNLPAALATLGDDAAFERVSLAQAHITHHHAWSDAAVLGLGHLTRGLLAGEDAQASNARIDALVAAWPAFRFTPYPGRASGYVVDTVQTVLHCYTQHADFESAVVAAVNQGDDADTTGALVGMLAGARCGAQALPQGWLHRLQPAVRLAVTAQTGALLALTTGNAHPSITQGHTMPMHDFHCTACQADFEQLVRSSTVPTCPQCGSTVLERRVSRIAPAGKIEAIRMSNRRAAAREGHFSHFSPSERAKILKS